MSWLTAALAGAPCVPGGLRHLPWPADRIPLRDAVARSVEVATGSAALPFESLHERAAQECQLPEGDRPNPLTGTLSSAGPAAIEAYHTLVSHLAREVLGTDVVFEHDPPLRFRFPVPMPPRFRTPDGTPLGHHTDTLYGDPFEQLNCWVPLSDCKGEAGLQYAPFEVSSGLLTGFAADTELDEHGWMRGRDQFFDWLLSHEDRRRDLLEATVPLELRYGEMAMFDPRVLHATADNIGGRTRVSVDFRLVPVDDYERIVARDRGPVIDDWLVRGGYYDRRTAFEL